MNISDPEADSKTQSLEGGVLVCSSCQKQINDSAPLGLCPRCLLESLVSSTGPFAAEHESAAIHQLRTQAYVGRGRFRLVRSLARGGMGEVWIAEDCLLGRRIVALKFVRPDWRNRDGFIHRLREELLLTRDLQHRGIVQVYDWHQEPEEPAFMSMEYVQGCALSEFMSSRPEGKLDYSTFHAIFGAVCEALHFAHSVRGLIHRDLKPGNILIAQTPTGLITKVADFGLAFPLLREGADADAPVGVSGTPNYMSPSQWLGLTPSRSDDIYALGVTMYQALTGRLPWAGDATQRNVAIPIGRLPFRDQPAKGVPAAILALIQRCLEVEVSMRPASISDILVELRKYPPTFAIQGPSETVPSSGMSQIIVDPYTPQPRGYWGELFFLLSVLLLAGMVIKWEEVRSYFGPQQSIPPPTPRVINSAPSFLTTNSQPDSAATQEASKAAEALGGETGTISLSIRNNRTLREVDVVLYRLQSGQWTSFRTSNYISSPEVKSGFDRVSFANCPPGRYGISIKWGGETVHSNQVDLAKGATLIEKFAAYPIDNPRGFLTTDPPYPDAALEYSQGYPSRTNQAQLFDGLIWVRVKVPSYHVLETNLLITEALRQASGKAGLRLPLMRSPAPLLDDVFSNRFDQFFLPLRGESVDGRPCWFGQSEVTKSMFSLYLKLSGAAAPEGMRSLSSNGVSREPTRKWDQPALFKLNDEHAAIGIGWQEAMDFCRWLTKTERELGGLLPHQEYSLPTVEQWHRARRQYPEHHRMNVAGTELLSIGWPWKHSVFSQHDSVPFVESALVTGLAPGERLLYHMKGNVQEWCLDAYIPTMNTAALLEAYDWTLAKPRAGSRAVCGGSWYDHDPLLWATDATLCADPTERTDFRGFRIVIVANGKEAK